jgi:hypothetical protein
MGMVLRTLRKNAREEDEPSEKRRVPYKLASYEHDREGKKFKSSKVVYSFWSASKYVLVLSLMLWWLPMFGQMIAGYVGGRRAGGPWKGVAASIFPVVALYGVVAGFSSGLLPSHVLGLAVAPSALATALNTNIPLLSPYLHFSSEYVGAFVGGLAGVSPYGINTYVLTVAFAYVGGVLAEQNRREIEYNSGSTTSNTTVLVHDPSVYGQQQVPHAWLAGMGSLLHLPAGHGRASGAFASRRRGDWASAQDVEYDENVLELGETGSYDGDDSQVNYARMPGLRRSKHHHKNHPVYQHPHHADPWNGKQKRRGAPNYSAKPRFRYQQYEEPRHQNRSLRQNRDFPRFTVSPNSKSIRRAERMIDDEWGHKKFSRFSEVEERDEPGSSQESEAVAVPKPREHHKPVHQWDQI